jgi:hypothetical protein
MAVKTRIAHPSVEERQAQGKEARDRMPRSSHSGWALATDRPDPVGLLQEQNRTREPDLVPVRHGRMLVSPFTFYRGGQDHGCQPQRHPRRRPAGAALRRRAPVELRGVRLTRAAAAVRPERC